MYELSRTSPNYRNLAARGVTVTKLKCLSFWDHRWVLEVTGIPSLPKETFKALTEYFLEAEFEASEFAWYKPRTNPDGNRAFCHFKSFAL